MALDATRGVTGRSAERYASGIDRDPRMYNQRDPNVGSVVASTHPLRLSGGVFVRALAQGTDILTDNLPPDVVTSGKIISDAILVQHLSTGSLHKNTAYGLVTNPNTGGQVRGLHPDVIIRTSNMPNNIVNDGVLASGGTNAERAVDSSHQKDNSTVNRIIATDAVDGRTIRTKEVANDHLKDSSVDGRTVKNKEIKKDHLAFEVANRDHNHPDYARDNHNHSEYATDAALQNHIASGHGGGGMMPQVVPMSQMLGARHRGMAESLREELRAQEYKSLTTRATLLLLDILLDGGSPPWDKAIHL